MNKIIFARMLGASALMVAMIVAAHAQSPRVGGASQTTQAPAPANPQGTVQQSAPLFMIDGVPVRAWAPVEAPYGANMNRTPTEGPMWDFGNP